MPVYATFKCDGCFDEKQSAGWFKRLFISVNGRSWGIGSYQYTQMEELTPEGWVAFDPYTSCCYCPNCWKEITYDKSDTPEGDL